MQYEVKTKKLPKSQVEIEASLPADILAAARKKAITRLSESLDIAGFRKGHIPENIVVEKVGEAGLLEEAADIALKEHFHKIIEQEGLDTLGHPQISVTKLALGNPMEFKAVCTVMPEIELPDYKKIANEVRSKSNEEQEKKDSEASDKEVEDVLLQIRKNKAHFDFHKNNPDVKDHNHASLDLEKAENLPPLDDELAKAAGNFKDLEELKGKIAENIVAEKKARENEKRRAAIIEEILKKTEIDLPEILVESETQKAMAQMKDDIGRMGMKWEEYLSHTKKSEEDLKKDLRESSEKKAKIQLIFNKIAVAEKIEPNKEILENEVKELKKHYPDASEMNLRIYVATLLINQEVLKILENQ